MSYVNRPVQKKDAMQLVTGKPVFTGDLVDKNALVVKILHSPHANAMIEDINISVAMKVPGIEAIYTYKDVPQNRFTMAGQTYPEPSPYDRLILDRHVRFHGDAVAIVAGESEKAVNKALKLIKVKYEVLTAILDFHKALDHEILVHPEDNWKAMCPVGADNKRNLCARAEDEHGDVEAVLADCDVVLERTYHSKANSQAMMETFRTYTYIDTYGRLVLLSATQIVFHVRRIMSHALGIPKSKIRVIKPRIGGGFGAKQTSVTEVFPAFVTWMTKKPAYLVYDREETQTSGCPRHEMEMHVKIGANKDGKIRVIDLHTLSNTGAYGEHGPTTVGLSGHKSIPLYSKNQEAYRFTYDVVYTNVQAAGAYRGYGATQGLYAIETIVNELAVELGMDPVELRQMNIIKEGGVMPAYYGETANACALDRCLTATAERMNWEEKYPCKDMGNGKVRGVGVALAMQGSAISNCDVGGATIKLCDDGTYMLHLGAADMGTGCDTVMAQMAADVLECDFDDISVISGDTDVSPYDSGSYASSTTYLTGIAVEKACRKLRDSIQKIGAQLLGCDVEETDFNGKTVSRLSEEEGAKNEVTLFEIGVKTQVNNSYETQFTATASSPVSPPPYMAGMAEVEIDTETGEIRMINYEATVDCGTPVNPNLARVQTEGGIAQGIGMALFEDISYGKHGEIRERNFMQYKIPTRQDVGRINVEFEASYEPTSPFGAKSIGEVVINTPSPAITHAVYNATGVWHRELPITPEKILKSLKK
ncbi:MAG: molybdopterin cofactor-binding domain-containing protein [Ruminococcus sp.]|nr:molybdopterin cofactor-binding domain-containing protein [Ruminococcus sp.]